MFNFEHLDILWVTIGHPSKKLWLFEFTRGFLVQFQVCRYLMRLNQISESKVMVVWICPRLPCRILSVLVYYGPQFDIWVKIYGWLNLSVASLFNFDHLDILLVSIKHPSQILWLFKFVWGCVVEFLAPQYIMHPKQSSKSYRY